METSSERTAEDEGTIEVDPSADADQQVTRRGSVRTEPAQRDPDDAWMERSKKVQKRLVAMNRQFDQRLAEQQAEFQRQLADRDQRLAALEGRRTEAAPSDEAAHQKQQDELQAQIEAAQEEGDSKKVAQLMRQMSEADAKYWAAKTAKQLGNGQTSTEQGSAQAATKAKVRVPTQAGKAFVRANGDWWDDPDETAQDARAYANSLHTEMLKSGELDPETPEYFEAIRKKVAKRFPEIETVSTLPKRERDEDDEQEERDEVRDQRRLAARRAPSQNFANRGEPSARARRTGITTLTGAEQRAMRAVNMDPNNDAHVKAYVQSLNEGVA